MHLWTSRRSIGRPLHSYVVNKSYLIPQTSRSSCLRTYVGYLAVRRSSYALIGSRALEDRLEALEAIEELSTSSGCCLIVREESEVETGAMAYSTP